MALPTKKDIDELLKEYDYIPTEEAKRMPRYQVHQISERLFAIGRKVIMKAEPPNEDLVIPEGLPWELGWYYEASYKEETGLSGYGHIIQKVKKGKNDNVKGTV